MKILRTIGLLLFIIGFGIFSGIFFSNEYVLSKEGLAQHLTEKQQLLFEEKQLEHGKIYSNSFAFTKFLQSVMEQVNNSLLQDLTPTEQEINSIVQHNQGLTFSLASLDQVYNDSVESEAFKKSNFISYGNWLEGRAFNNEQEMQEALQGVANNIAQYGIVSSKGFDQYKSKYLLYALTKTSAQGPVKDYPYWMLFLTFGLSIIGASLYILPKTSMEPPGIKNNGIYHNAMSNKGWLGILTGSYLILFYVFLYFYKEHMTSWILMVDPISMFLKGQPAGEFFLYGFLYTLCILVMGVRMIIKYRHSRYQVARTISVMFFQTAFAFLIPEILIRLNQPYYDFKNIWPLDYDFFFDNELNTLIANGNLGLFMIGWGLALTIVAVPVGVYFFGKRWYCSWVCGCGGLAETLGDPYRQLSDKSVKAWKFERISIHSVLVFAIVMTAGVLYTYFTGSAEVVGISTYKIREWYGAGIGAAFAGVVGTGFYPLMGNRVWCRFGCPLAAYLGLIQRFKSRFRITTNGGQCISCGNCSTYCEMGIDVRWYAQRGQNIVRSSCVGCGVCSSVCPRGVLNLEVKDEKGRLNQPSLLGNDSFKN